MLKLQMQLLKGLVPIVVASVYKFSIKRGGASYIKAQKASKLQKDSKQVSFKYFELCISSHSGLYIMIRTSFD